METAQMNDYTISVSLAILRAARTHSAENDLRKYLNGVFLDTKAGKVVATDGHRLFCAHARGVKIDAPPVIVPNETLDAAFKQFNGDYARGKMLGNADVLITVKNKTLTIATPSGQVSGTALDGNFPEWRRVVPTAENVGEYVPAVCNYEYISDACDAIVIARNKTKKAAKEHAVKIYYRGEFPAIVHDGNADVFAIVMPMRNEIHSETHLVACRMAHEDALPYSEETRAHIAEPVAA